MNNEKGGLSPLQGSFYRLLGQERPKPVHPKLVLIYGFPLAIMINQLLYWHGRGIRKDGYIYKTEKDLTKETGLSAAQQKLAIDKGRSYGYLEVVRKGIPAKRHYKLHYSRLLEATQEVAKEKNIILSKAWYELGEKHQTNTENTQIYGATKNTSRNRRLESISSIMERRNGKL